MVINSVILW